jgi:hypothetical protein
MMAVMDEQRRRNLVTELCRLNTHEFDSLVEEVRERGNTSELGAQALAAALEASRQPLAARLFAGNDEEDE